MISLLLLLLSLLCISDCFDLLPMSCNVSVTDSCPASLYYIPTNPGSINATAALFSVAPGAVTKTSDGFLIEVDCACLADHGEYIWHTGYTVGATDTWELIEERFGLLVRGRTKKKLIPGMNVSLDVLCGCLEGTKILTYTIQPGDTLYVISLRFKVNIGRITVLNRVADAALIYAGDTLFIPVTGLGHLTVLDENDSNTKVPSKFWSHSILGIMIPATISILVTIVLFTWIYHKRKEHHKSNAVFGGSKSSHIRRTFPSCACKLDDVLGSLCSCKGSTTLFGSAKTPIFPYYEVCNATSKFSASLKIGQGSYGSVYRGRLREVDVAVKQMKNTKSKEFFAELNILCTTHHDNLIKLLGYSAGAESFFLVYEFAENGALSGHLHNPAIKGQKPLSWSKRVHIALDVAKGLDYIHVQIKPFCIHRDVKTSNILLDSNFRAKIADFGLGKLLEHSAEDGVATTKLVGTFGYLAPEYVRDGCVTPKTDVYAYGVVLMELITGQPALSRTENAGDKSVQHRTIVDYMLSALEACHDSMAQLVQIVDPNLIHYHKDFLLQMSFLAKDCVDDDWRRRPDMSQVVLQLSQIIQVMEQDEVLIPLPNR